MKSLEEYAMKRSPFKSTIRKVATSGWAVTRKRWDQVALVVSVWQGPISGSRAKKKGKSVWSLIIQTFFNFSSGRCQDLFPPILSSAEKSPGNEVAHNLAKCGVDKKTATLKRKENFKRLILVKKQDLQKNGKCFTVIKNCIQN